MQVKSSHGAPPREPIFFFTPTMPHLRALANGLRQLRVQSRRLLHLPAAANLRPSGPRHIADADAPSSEKSDAQDFATKRGERRIGVASGDVVGQAGVCA